MEIRLRDVEASREHWRGKYFALRHESPVGEQAEAAPSLEPPREGGVWSARAAPVERGR